MMPLALLMVVVILFVLAGGALLAVRIARRRGFRFQYSLRSLFILTTVVALVLGLIRAWPSHVATVDIPRIEFKSGIDDLTHDAASLDIVRCLGRTTLWVTPRHGFGETSSAEVFWLEAGKVRHVALAEKGKLLTTAIPGPTEFPFKFGVVVYHPKTTLLIARRVLASGMGPGGATGIYEPNNPTFDGGIEKWGKRCLERLLPD
jgi:hypothetical protein